MNIMRNQDASNPVHKLFVDDLDFYGAQLMNLVQTYRDCIYLKTDHEVDVLNELEYYARQIVNRQYDTIISNASEIITNNTDEVPF